MGDGGTAAGAGVASGSTSDRTTWLCSRSTRRIRLDDEQAENLEAIAQTEGVPVSQVIREAVTALVETRRHDAEFQERLSSSVERNRRIIERLVE